MRHSPHLVAEVYMHIMALAGFLERRTEDIDMHEL